MSGTDSTKKMLEQYEKDMDVITNKILSILIRAQRKKDDKKYNELLDKLNT